MKRVLALPSHQQVYYVSDSNLASVILEKFVKREFQDTLEFLLPEVYEYSMLRGLWSVLLED